MSANRSSEPRLSPPRRILLALEGSAASRRALTYLRDLAPSDAELLLVSVAEDPTRLVPPTTLAGAEPSTARDDLLQDASDTLEQARRLLDNAGLRSETSVLDLSRGGRDIAHALAETAQTWGADLIVAGARQHHGLQRWFEGTVSEPLAKLAKCPLLIVPAAYEREGVRVPERILFAVDGSDPARRAMQYGVHFATASAQLRAIYVVDRAVRFTDIAPIHLLAEAFVEEGQAALAEAERLLAHAPGSKSSALIHTERTADDIAHAIVREAVRWNADLLVMGTHGRRGLARWFLGSVAGRVVHIAQTPLLLVSMQDN